jgi:dihydrofolate reductase
MRKIIAYLATSADGFIARPDGAVDWLDPFTDVEQYGMTDFYNSIDTVLLGRKTYEKGLEFGQTSYVGKTNYVFSRTATFPGVETINTDALEFARHLRAGEGKDIWAVGGAELFGVLLDGGALDALVLHVVPVLIGEGIPLLKPTRRTTAMKLVLVKGFTDGVVQLDYALGAGA